MATVTVSTNQGTLYTTAPELLSQMTPYQNMTLKARIEPILNYYSNINNAVSNDYNAGGYFKYGLLPNGQLKFDLDGYELWYTGTFSSSGSQVTNIVVMDLSNRYVVQIEGNIAYTGLPFFTGVNGISRITSLGYVNATGTEASSLQVNATINSSSVIAGEITAMGVQFVDSSGQLVTRDFTSGGNVAFTNASGSFNVLSGGFTSNSIDNRSYPLNDPLTLLDYILVENFFMPITATTATFNAQLLDGNDNFTLIGSRGSNVYTGGGNDTVNGSLHADTIFTGAGNDLITGNGGNDFIDGGIGIDTAVYLGAYSQYGGSLATGTIIDTIANRDGTDTLTNVERLKFSDINLALDIGPTENAGSVYMLYKAAFNRPSDAGGMGYWIAQKDAGANIVTSIAQGFVNSAEFIAKYGANPTNASYVNNLYQNVLGRAGEAGGVAYWTGEMDAGRVSKAQALVQFATLPEGASLVAPLIANGIQYQEWVG
jgi:Ca2+-binding RTX toxin-like protein